LGRRGVTGNAFHGASACGTGGIEAERCTGNALLQLIVAGRSGVLDDVPLFGGGAVTRPDLFAAAARCTGGLQAVRATGQLDVLEARSGNDSPAG